MTIAHNEENLTTFNKDELREIIKARVTRISGEFETAFNFISKFPKSVTFFGSARCTEDSDHYKQARSLAKAIVKNLGYTVITGGSAGIMEAANRGAIEAGGQSVGLNIRLPHEQRVNGYTTESLDFSFFFVRKVALSFAAEAYIFLPGGFGTLDEFFEILTLVQTHKIRRVPILLVGKDYWEPLNEFIKLNMLEIHNAIDKSDMDLYRIVDDESEICEIIKNVPIRSGIPNPRPANHGQF